MHIAIDAMGGDLAPQSVIDGLFIALERFPELEVTVIGQEDAIRRAAGERQFPERVTILHKEDVIETGEPPMIAVRSKPDSSLMTGVTMVKDKAVDAFVSAGSTGALMAGALLKAGRIRGIRRPALGTVLPGMKGKTLMLDCGANANCKSEYLLQFAVMGSAYMEGVEGIKSPRVGLVNIGTEEEKGNDLYKETHQLLKQAQALNFVGNVEPREALSGDVDVLVADGFSGNMVLKSIEGTAGFIMTLMKDLFMSSTRSKLGALLLKPALRVMKHRLDYTEIGGSPLLGVDGCIIKAHGSSNGKAFANAIGQAVRYTENDVTAKIAAHLAQYQDQ